MPKEETDLNITNEVYKEPIEVMKKLSSNIDGLNYTKVIQTYVLENKKLDLSLIKQNSSYFDGKIVWIGNKKDDTEGTVFCVDSRDGLKQLNPTPDNSDKIILDKKKNKINIFATSNSKCAVCNKDIEIFDEIGSCPLCGAEGHKEHMVDWIRMKHSCPVCKKSLNVSSTGVIFID